LTTEATQLAPLKAPFPWFGGKSRVAADVWARFGDVRHYIEPFFGSGAVLFGRPHAPRVETVNDLYCFVANLWRAIQSAPGHVAHYADQPINEADLHARHVWLVGQMQRVMAKIDGDPFYYNARIAGWWVWGQSSWIGSGWCAGGRKGTRPDILSEGKGIHRKRPNLVHGGKGVNRGTPNVADPGGRGVNRHMHLGRGMGVQRKRPKLTGGGEVGVQRVGITHLHAYMEALAARLRRVRVCCGDWSRVVTDAVLTGPGTPTGIFLDPPYAHDIGRDLKCYSEDHPDLSGATREWALAHGDDERYRIALCGYEGEHEMPDTWECLAWRAKGGYANQAGGARTGPYMGQENRRRERIWFSPHCTRVAAQAKLFAGDDQ